MNALTCNSRFGSGVVISETLCMSQIGDCVAAVAPCEVEDECLFLPSDFAVGDHHCYNLEQLVVEEIKL